MTLKNRIKGYRPKPHKVAVEGVGDFFLRKISGGELLKFMRWQDTLKDGDDQERTVKGMARLLRLTLVDESGASDLTEEDDDWLLDQLSLATIKTLAEEASKVNGMSNNAAEEVRKNSEARPSNDSPTDSVSKPDASTLNGALTS